MRTEQLKYFIEVANCGSMNVAAKHLFMTQPALTLAIKALEKDLGLQLFHRSKSGVVLTEAGEEVLKDSRVVLEIENKWHAMAGTDVVVNEVKVVANPCAYEFLSGQLSAYAVSCNPPVGLVCNEEKNQFIFKQLIDREVDIGIVSFVEDDRKAFDELLEKNRLQDMLLFVDPLCACINAQSPLAQKDSLEKTDLLNLKLAMYSEEDDNVCGPYYSKFFVNGKHLRFNNLRAVLQSVIDLETVCFYPGKLIARHSILKAGQIKIMPINGYAKNLEYHLIAKNEASLSSAAQKVMGQIWDIFARELA